MFLPLSQSGALRDDSSALSVGLVQLLPQRDLAGRALIFFDPSRYDTKSSKYSNDSLVRSFC